MTIIAAVIAPGTPLLVPEISGTSTEHQMQIRSASREAVRWLLDEPGKLLIVAGTRETREYQGGVDWRPLGLETRDNPRAAISGSTDSQQEPRLPTPLAIGSWLVDQTDPAHVKEFVGVATTAPADSCRLLGERLTGSESVKMLVIADGSARRSERAPGHLHPGAVEFDNRIELAVRHGDTEALLTVSPEEADRMLCLGRAPLQVLAGAFRGRRPSSRVDYSDDPYGVKYLVARWEDRLE